MNVHEQWMKSLEITQKQLKEQGVDVQLPPPSMIELKMEYMEVIPGKKMVAKIPFQQRFTNPIRTFQGGFLAAGIDDVFGPLSYVSAGRPCTTLSLNTTFLKPFLAKHEFCLIEAEILQKTKSFIFMRAKVTSPDGEILAHAESHVSILRDDQLAKVKA